MEESHDDQLSSPLLSERKVKTRTVGRLFNNFEPRMSSFNDLPPELLFNIFVRLPLYSILHIRRTCKLWYKLMSSQRRTQVGHLVLTPKQLYYVEKMGSNLYLLGPKPRSRRVDESIYYPYSSGGLVASRACSCPNLYYYYIIENPITGERFEIPDEPVGYMSYGFGYSPSTNEYKLVRIGCLPYPVSVFTLGSRHWRQVGDAPFSPNSKLPVECEGSVFWTIHRNNKAISMNTLVMSFDVGSECFRSWKGPKVGEDIIRDNIHVVKMGNYVACVYGRWINELQIWVLKDMAKDEWVKEHNIFSGISPPLMFDYRICSGTWMDNDVFFGRDDEVPISYYRYLYVKNSDRGIIEELKTPLRGMCSGAVPHIGSLVSPLNLVNNSEMLQ